MHNNFLKIISRSQSARQHSRQSAAVDQLRVNSNKFLRSNNKNQYDVWRQNILNKKDVRNRDGTKRWFLN